MEEQPPAASGAWPAWIEQWVLPYVREPGLWPVAFALLGHLVMVLALAILRGVRDGGVLGVASLGVLFMVSASLVVEDVRRAGRPAGVSGFLLLTWGLAGLVAWGASAYGLL